MVSDSYVAARYPKKNIKGLEQQEEEQEIHTPNAREFPLKQLYDAFPNIQLQPGQIGLIQADVKQTDKAAWLSTIKIYTANHDPTRNRYLPEKVGTLLKVFEKEKLDLEKQQNGSNQNGNKFNPSRNGNQTASPGNSRTDAETLEMLGIGT